MGIRVAGELDARYGDGVRDGAGRWCGGGVVGEGVSWGGGGEAWWGIGRGGYGRGGMGFDGGARFWIRERSALRMWKVASAGLRNGMITVSEGKGLSYGVLKYTGSGGAASEELILLHGQFLSEGDLLDLDIRSSVGKVSHFSKSKAPELN